MASCPIAGAVAGPFLGTSRTAAGARPLNHGSRNRTPRRQQAHSQLPWPDDDPTLSLVSQVILREVL
jgi:hypothetical protein